MRFASPLLLACASLAQTQITGTVIDERGAPVPAADVWLSPAYDPLLVFGAEIFVQAYQAILHTEAIPKLHRWIEQVFNSNTSACSTSSSRLFARCTSSARNMPLLT